MRPRLCDLLWDGRQAAWMARARVAVRRHSQHDSCQERHPAWQHMPLQLAAYTPSLTTHALEWSPPCLPLARNDRHTARPSESVLLDQRAHRQRSDRARRTARPIPANNVREPHAPLKRLLECALPPNEVTHSLTRIRTVDKPTVPVPVTWGSSDSHHNRQSAELGSGRSG